MRNIKTSELSHFFFEKSENTHRFFYEIKKFSPLTKEEEYKHIKNWQENKSLESRNKLVNSNIRFVISVAKKYHTSNNLMYSIDDLINVSVLGLIEAIDRFETDREIRLLSYGVFYIQKNILNYMQKTCMIIKTPSNYLSQSIKIKKILNNHLVKYGFEPTKEFICKNYKIKGNMYDFVITEEVITRIDDDDILSDNEIKNNIYTNDFENQNNDESSSDLFYKANIFCEKMLSGKEKTVFQHTYTKDSPIHDNTEELAEILNITTTRVQQIKKSIKQKLQENKEFFV